MNEEKTLTVTTLSGAIYEFPDTQQGRGKIIRDLAALEEGLFPLHRTDVVEIGPSAWMAIILSEEPCVTHTNGPYPKKHFFRLDPSCFAPSTVVESPTERDLQSTSLGVPLNIELYSILYHDKIQHYIDHLFRQDNHLLQQMCYRCEGDNKSVREQLEHCCHAIQTDGSCQKLTEKAITDILRLYDVYQY